MSFVVAPGKVLENSLWLGSDRCNSHCFISLTMESPSIVTLLFPRRLLFVWVGKLSSVVEPTIWSLVLSSKLSHWFSSRSYLFEVSNGISELWLMLCTGFLGSCHAFWFSIVVELSWQFCVACDNCWLTPCSKEFSLAGKSLLLQILSSWKGRILTVVSFLIFPIVLSNITPYAISIESCLTSFLALQPHIIYS